MLSQYKDNAMCQENVQIMQCVSGMFRYCNLSGEYIDNETYQSNIYNVMCQENVQIMRCVSGMFRHCNLARKYIDNEMRMSNIDKCFKRMYR